MFTAVRLAKQGYFGGDPDAVLNAPTDIVESVLEYETFETDYGKEYDALNPKPGQ